jgi:hypothetical protein
MNRQHWFAATALGVFDRTEAGQKDGWFHLGQSGVCGVKIVSVALDETMNDKSGSTSKYSHEQSP